MNPRRLAALALALSSLAICPGGAPAADVPKSERLLAQRGGGRRAGGAGGAGAAVISLGRVLTQGSVQTVDRTTGQVELKTDGGTIEASFSPSVLEQVKQGDTALIVVDLIDPRVAAMTGSVTAVDPAQGTVVIATSRGTLTLHPSPGALAQMKVGDPLLLKLELVDIGPPPDLEKKN